jgi:periplasmic protein TonB
MRPPLADKTMRAFPTNLPETNTAALRSWPGRRARVVRRRAATAAAASAMVHCIVLTGFLISQPPPPPPSEPPPVLVSLIDGFAPPSAPAPSSAPRATAPHSPTKAVERPAAPVAEWPSPSVAANSPPSAAPAAPSASAPSKSTAETAMAPLPAGPVNLGSQLAVACPVRPPASYPEASRRAGDTGVVIVRVELSEAGRVDRATIAASSGHAELDRAALEAVRGWRCAPPKRSGQAVRAIAEQPFNFSLHRRS